MSMHPRTPAGQAVVDTYNRGGIHSNGGKWGDQLGTVFLTSALDRQYESNPDFRSRWDSGDRSILGGGNTSGSTLGAGPSATNQPAKNTLLGGS